MYTTTSRGGNLFAKVGCPHRSRDAVGPVLLSLALVLGLEGQVTQVLGLGLGLEQKSLALAKQVLGLAE